MKRAPPTPPRLRYGDPCQWHVDADPASLPPGAPFVEHAGYYYNRWGGRPKHARKHTHTHESTHAYEHMRARSHTTHMYTHTKT